MQKRLGQFIRWLLTWPILVVLALNINNSATKAGYGSVIDQHWKDALPVLKDLYDLATSTWLWYPTLVLTGAVCYEWIVYTIKRCETDGSGFQRWLVQRNAETFSPAFLKKGFTRRNVKPDVNFYKLNSRLVQFDMPLLPPDYDESEEINAVYGSYLLLLSKGQFAHAKAFILSQDLSPRLTPETLA